MLQQGRSAPTLSAAHHFVSLKFDVSVATSQKTQEWLGGSPRFTRMEPHLAGPPPSEPFHERLMDTSIESVMVGRPTVVDRYDERIGQFMIMQNRSASRRASDDGRGVARGMLITLSQPLKISKRQSRARPTVETKTGAPRPAHALQKRFVDTHVPRSLGRNMVDEPARRISHRSDSTSRSAFARRSVRRAGAPPSWSAHYEPGPRLPR